MMAQPSTPTHLDLVAVDGSGHVLATGAELDGAAHDAKDRYGVQQVPCDQISQM